MREHEAQWLAPAPLWGTTGADAYRPALVRINSDDFMDQFAQMLATGAAGAAALWDARPSAADAPKLPVRYPSVHGSYALVCASLTCKVTGRPEKAVAPARGESVGFVLRRVGGGSEEGWFPAGNGEGEWKPAEGAVVGDGEEVIPLFPVPVVGAARRRVWAGLVPTASRETYQPAPAAKTETPRKDGRLSELDSGPLEALAQTIAVPAAADPHHDAILAASNEAALQAALALADFINDYVLPTGGFAKEQIKAFLDSPELGKPFRDAGLATAMKNAWARKGELLGTKKRADDYTSDAGGLTLPVDPDALKRLRGTIATTLSELTTLGRVSPRASNVPGPKLDPAFDPKSPQQYTIRCVYSRTACPAAPVVSPQSAAFTIADIHDPGAPARTIRIPMPIDVSIAGLRSAKKNVGFVLSAALLAKVQSLSGKKLKDIDDGNVSDSGGVDLGEVCTFALPIITLCAMIVLYIFVALLNIVFFWMPLLKICLPIPKPKAS